MSRRKRRSRRTRKFRVGTLDPGEQVMLVESPSRLLALPKYLVTLGLYGIWRKRDITAVTDRRLIFGRGVIRRDERTIPLSRIKDVTFSRRGLSSYANVFVGDDRGPQLVRVGPMSARRARALASKAGHHLR